MKYRTVDFKTIQITESDAGKEAEKMPEFRGMLERMENYPDIGESIVPWVTKYFPNHACSACGFVGPSNICKSIMLYAHIEYCDVYTREEKGKSFEEWDAAYKNEDWAPTPALRDGIPISKLNRRPR
jgi:hypothetical protein